MMHTFDCPNGKHQRRSRDLGRKNVGSRVLGQGHFEDQLGQVVILDDDDPVEISDLGEASEEGEADRTAEVEV